MAAELDDWRRVEVVDLFNLMNTTFLVLRLVWVRCAASVRFSVRFVAVVDEPRNQQRTYDAHQNLNKQSWNNLKHYATKIRIKYVKQIHITKQNPLTDRLTDWMTEWINVTLITKCFCDHLDAKQEVKIVKIPATCWCSLRFFRARWCRASFDSSRVSWSPSFHLRQQVPKHCICSTLSALASEACANCSRRPRTVLPVNQTRYARTSCYQATTHIYIYRVVQKTDTLCFVHHNFDK